MADEEDYLTSTRPRRQRSCVATVANLCFVFVYIFALIAVILSLAFFGLLHNYVHEFEQPGDCILYSSKYPNESFMIGDGATCNVLLGGEGILTLICLLLILVAFGRTLWGRWISCMLGCSFLLLVQGLVLAFCLGIILSVGFDTTCHSYKTSKQASTEQSCSGYVLQGTNVHFGHYLHITEIGLWICFGILSISLILEIAISCCACVCCKKRNHTNNVNDWLDKRYLSRGPQ